MATPGDLLFLSPLFSLTLFLFFYVSHRIVHGNPRFSFVLSPLLSLTLFLFFYVSHRIVHGNPR